MRIRVPSLMRRPTRSSMACRAEWPGALTQAPFVATLRALPSLSHLVKSHARSTAVNLLFNYAQTIYLVVFGIVLTPLYISHIPLDIYGAWLATGNIAAWLAMLDPGLHYVVQHKIAKADASEDLLALSVLRNQSYVLSAIVAAIILALGFACIPIVERYVSSIGCSEPRTLGLAFAIAAAGTALTVLACGIAVVNAGLQQYFAHGISFLLAQTANLATVLSLLFMGHGVLAIAWGIVAQAAVMAVANMAFTSATFRNRGIRFTTDIGNLRPVVRESSGTVMARIAGCLSSQVDMILAATFLGAQECVSLSVTSKGPGTALTFAQRISHAAMPSLSAIDARSDSEQRARAMELLSLVTIWTAAAAAGGALFLNHGFVSAWVGTNLYLGPVANALIAAGVLSLSLEATLSNSTIAFGEFGSHGRTQLLKSALGIAIALSLLPRAGVVGLLVAPLIAAALTTWRIYPTLTSAKCRWTAAHWRRFLSELCRSIVAVFVAGMAAQAMPQHSVWTFIAAAGIFALVYAGSLAALSPAFRKLVPRAIPMKVASKLTPAAFDSRARAAASHPQPQDG